MEYPSSDDFLSLDDFERAICDFISYQEFKKDEAKEDEILKSLEEREYEHEKLRDVLLHNSRRQT